jgi:uncharacterized LabA/DUF88 family protein
MEKIENLEKIVVLIDADNAQLKIMKSILEEISTYGRIVVKKAYGNWKDPILKNWEEELKRLAIKPEQQFAYTTGKNATDISLVIGAMDLLYTEMYDAFVLVSSDSDYTPLVIRLREAGVYVFGVGEEKTPVPFRNACDNFILTRNLVDNAKADEYNTKETETLAPIPAKNSVQSDVVYIHDLLKTASEKYQDPDGWVNVSSAGAYIKRVKPDFDAKTYGHSKLSDLLKAFPEKYETKTLIGKGAATIFAYRCVPAPKTKRRPKPARDHIN